MQRNLTTLCLGVLLLIVGFGMVGKAAGKPFWFDEILTLRIAQCPTWPEMWQAMTAGFDLNPPALYVGTRMSELALGRGLFASRLPSILSGLIVLVCLFRVASRRGGVASGFGSVLLLGFTAAFGYFSEARAYAMVMAGAMIAWVFWQARLDSTQRSSLHLLGISGGLTLALCAHLWALVLPGCFLISLIAGRRRNEGIDTGALSAMVAPGLVALMYPPIVAASRKIQFAGEIYEASLRDAYGHILGNLPFLLLVSAIVFVASTVLSQSPRVESVEPRRGVPIEEVVLALCLICAPMGIFVATRLMHSAFMARYALISVLGLTFLLGQVFNFFERRAQTACYLWLLVLGLGLSASSVHSIAAIRRPPDPVSPELSIISGMAGNNEPIVYSSGVSFLQADYYAAPEIATRLVYVADRQLAKEIAGTDGVDAVYVLGRKYLGVRGQVLSWQGLQHAHRRFLLVDDSKAPLNWLSEKLRADGAEIRALSIPGSRIFHVDLH